MKIYTDHNGNIKNINTNSDDGLKEIEVDRLIFGNRTDFEILQCIYEQISETEYTIRNKPNSEQIILEEKIRQQELVIAALLLEGVTLNA